MALCLGAVLAPVAHGAGTAAGTSISNTASVSYEEPGGTPVTLNSNTEQLTVDEVLDLTVVANTAGNLAVGTPDTDRVLSFTVTNTGNGPETLMLSVDAAVAGDQFDPANVRVYLDDGDGLFDPLVDTLHVAGVNDPLLAADAGLVVFVVSDIPASLADGNIGRLRLRAEALTAQATPGSDAPGTVFAGQGAGGSDAVVGANAAEGVIESGYAVTRVAATFAKSQLVSDPFSGSNPVPGATITYTLVLDVTGTGSLANVKIVDAIPASTSYVPGSLTLNGNPLTDVADADEGVFAAGQVEVVPTAGTVTAPATHTVTFQVVID